MRETAYKQIEQKSIVMEETLREHIEHNGNLTMDETLQRMTPVMKTLEHMHKRADMHGDISPDNLRVLRDGSLKLTDPEEEDQFKDITLTRLVAGSCYSPPEKLDVKGVFGSWSDVYSICAVMYFCITGKDPDDVVTRLLFDDLKRPSELDADITSGDEKTLMRGLMLDSNNRIHDMIQLQQSFTIER